MKKIVIIGATSAMATAWARRWADKHAAFYLVGRNKAKLESVGADLKARGAGPVETYALDINHIEQHETMMADCWQKLGQIDIALVAYGTLPSQAQAEANVDYAVREFTNNATSTIALLTLLANKMQAQGSGTLAVISSVAGDRGRASNYLYGAAKAALTTFCSGLRGRLSKKGVHVVTIKPGFIQTPMTQDLDLPKLLIRDTDTAAKCIDKAIERNKNTVYVPAFWWGIMVIIKSIPEGIFKKLSI